MQPSMQSQPSRRDGLLAAGAQKLETFRQKRLGGLSRRALGESSSNTSVLAVAPVGKGKMSSPKPQVQAKGGATMVAADTENSLDLGAALAASIARATEGGTGARSPWGAGGATPFGTASTPFDFDAPAARGDGAKVR